MKIRRVLVPVDFSPNSKQAVDFTIDLAKPFKAELVVLFVLEPVLYAVGDYSGAQTSALAELITEQRHLGRVELARIQRRCEKRGVKVRVLLQTGRPSQAIVEMAAQSKADLIVMATHGRTGVSRVLMGSVTERVVRTAGCPVLTLHAGKGRARAAAPRAKQRSTSRERV